MQEIFNYILEWFHYINDTFSLIFSILYYAILFTIVNILAYATVKMLVIYIHMLKDLAENIRDFLLFPTLRTMIKLTSFISNFTGFIFNYSERKRARDKEELELTRRVLANLSMILDEEIEQKNEDKLNSTYGNLVPTQETLSKKRLEEAYSILGVNAYSTYDSVVKAYKVLIKQYHPDRFQSGSSPKDVLIFVQNRFKEIQNAYDTIIKYGGVK